MSKVFSHSLTTLEIDGNDVGNSISSWVTWNIEIVTLDTLEGKTCYSQRNSLVILTLLSCQVWGCTMTQILPNTSRTTSLDSVLDVPSRVRESPKWREKCSKSRVKLDIDMTSTLAEKRDHLLRFFSLSCCSRRTSKCCLPFVCLEEVFRRGCLLSKFASKRSLQDIFVFTVDDASPCLESL